MDERTPDDGFDFDGPLADVKAAALDALKESCGIQPRTNAGQCTWCNKQIDPLASFKDELSLKEWRISGLCQKCQDATFDVFEDGPPEEEEEECDELGVKLTADKLQELGRCGFGCSCCEYEDETAPCDHAAYCGIIRGGDCSCEGAEERATERKRRNEEDQQGF